MIKPVMYACYSWKCTRWNTHADAQDEQTSWSIAPGTHPPTQSSGLLTFHSMTFCTQAANTCLRCAYCCTNGIAAKSVCEPQGQQSCTCLTRTVHAIPRTGHPVVCCALLLPAKRNRKESDCCEGLLPIDCWCWLVRHLEVDETVLAVVLTESHHFASHRPICFSRSWLWQWLCVQVTVKCQSSVSEHHLSVYMIVHCPEQHWAKHNV